MKKTIFLILIIHCSLLIFNCVAQSSATMQVWKSGSIINTIPLSDIDSITFTPCYSNCGKVKDYDGNVYSTVIIGTQCWMQRNLNVTHYRNGDSIPNVKNDNAWDNLTTGAYCNYDNNDSIAKIYGRLYNQYAVTDSNKICPAGWHVPSKSEFETLVNFLGDSAVAGGKLKEAGYSHWLHPNTGATNSSGFTALPAGYRDFISLSYLNYKLTTFLFTVTKFDNTHLWDLQLEYDDETLNFGGADENTGESIRCLKN